MGDGTGAVMIDGKMEDDASVKQCQVMVALAEELAAIDPELKEQYYWIEVADVRVHAFALRPLHAELQRARAREAKAIACDALILDLEDAVAPDAKPAAREAAAAAAASGDYGRRTVTIRVNGIGTEWHAADLGGRQAGPAAIVVPKVDTADQVAAWPPRSSRPALPTTPRSGRWSRRRRRLRRPRDRRRLTAAAGACPRHQRPRQELYAEHVPGRAPILPSLHTVLLAGRAAGIAVIDGVYNDVKDTDGFLAECDQGRQMGFDCKTLIHPGQVDGANTAFARECSERSNTPAA